MRADAALARLRDVSHRSASHRCRGCTRAVLSTLHFQAPGFYLKQGWLKQGWEVAARIDCEPPGHTQFYMTKKLS